MITVTYVKIRTVISKSDEFFMNNLKVLITKLSPHARISLEKLNDDNKSLFKFKNEKGLVITKVTPGSIAQIAGLSRGELIVNVNGKVIDNIKDFEAIVNNELKNGIRLLIEDSKMEHFVFLQSN